ncbi:MAG TPA: ABC-2 family transporter protein [Gemmataceae bacterium]|nr:ABC-2 family transporter protein [Gemmataceae bacterium]
MSLQDVTQVLMKSEESPLWLRVWATVRKYTNIFRVSLIERTAYRGDFLLGTILRFFPVITTILLWKAVFSGTQQHRIAGFSEQRMIAYLLLIHVSRMFSSMPGLSGTIARDIRDGTLKKYLVQPLDMIGYLLSYRAAHKVAYITTSAGPYAGLFFLCSGYFVDLWPDVLTLSAYAVSLLLAFVIGFFFETAMGMVGFWFLEVTSLLWVVNTVNYFVSGQMFPLDLLGPPWDTILKWLPFQYLAYFPAVVFLREVTGRALVEGLLMELAWSAALIVLSRWLFARGLRRYSAYGG